jgi:hypothetical protein
MWLMLLLVCSPAGSTDGGRDATRPTRPESRNQGHVVDIPVCVSENQWAAGSMVSRDKEHHLTCWHFHVLQLFRVRWSLLRRARQQNAVGWPSVWPHLHKASRTQMLCGCRAVRPYGCTVVRLYNCMAAPAYDCACVAVWLRQSFALACVPAII